MGNPSLTPPSPTPLQSSAVPNPTGENNIWLACADGDLATVKSLIESGNVAPNAQDENGYSALHAAASYDHMDIVEYLLSKDESLVHLTDEDGDTPLHAAETMEMAARLLEAGAVPDAKNNDNLTPLDVAFEDEREEVVDFLTQIYTRLDIPFNLPEVAGEADTLAHTLASDDEAEDADQDVAEPSAATADAMARIERALQRTDLEDGEAGDKELREAVTELVLGRLAETAEKNAEANE
ncbi:ankyrin repeat-containing domain protein [Catenaria anguillulae PL171]|uniref:Ankyrin repeat-containing domain protein n=1 Tax=Catenaria anguillulae PL171 TaxID=765915 RepID=A0A1Y2HCN5_9FUNG|nr:ankyrin repeat-containing domain protein [Catenaria anguillulae PL171]